MTGLEPQISGVGSYHSTNCATANLLIAETMWSVLREVPKKP